MRDYTTPARSALMLDMKSAAGEFGLPAASIYPAFVPGVPQFPFIRLGNPDSVPFSYSGSNGQSIAYTISAFAKGGDEKAQAIVDAIIARYGGTEDDDIGYELTMAGGRTAHLHVLGTRTIQDPDETAAFQGMVDVRIDIP